MRYKEKMGCCAKKNTTLIKIKISRGKAQQAYTFPRVSILDHVVCAFTMYKQIRMSVLKHLERVSEFPTTKFFFLYKFIFPPISQTLLRQQ